MRVHCVWQVMFASACCRECRAFDRTRTRSAFLVDDDGLPTAYVVLGRGREEDEHEVGSVRDRDGARRQVRRRRDTPDVRGRNGDGDGDGLSRGG